MGNPGFCFYLFKVENGDARGLTSSASGRGYCDERLKRTRNRTSFANWWIDIIDEVRWVARVKICRLSCVDGGTTANSDETFETSIDSYGDRLFKGGIAGFHEDLIV